MVSYKTYMPQPLKTTTSQTAQVATLVAFALTLVVTIGCTTGPLAKLHFVSFLAGDQRFSHMNNGTLTPVTYRWIRVGVSGQCVYSASTGKTDCNSQWGIDDDPIPKDNSRNHTNGTVGDNTNSTQKASLAPVRVSLFSRDTLTSTNTSSSYGKTKRPYFFEPPPIANVPQNRNSLLRRAGKAISVLYILSTVLLALGLGSGIAAIVQHESNRGLYYAHSAVAFVCVGSTVLTVGTCLSTATYSLFNKLLNNYDNSSVKDNFDLNSSLNEPAKFQPQLGSSVLALTWIATIAGLIAMASWVRLHLSATENRKRVRRRPSAKSSTTASYYH